MNILALDTASEACSVALMQNGQVYERHEYAPRQHAQLLLPMVDTLLAEAGIGKRQLDAIAVGRGPGGFAGVRLAISVAQGMAMGLDVPVLPVSSLAALAQEMAAYVPAAFLLACMDARMGEIYYGIYRTGVDALVELVGVEGVGAANEILLPEAEAWAVAGSGWGSYQTTLENRIGQPQFANPDAYPRAAMIARLALPCLQRGEGVSPELALPVYLRDKIALTTAERTVSR